MNVRCAVYGPGLVMALMMLLLVGGCGEESTPPGGPEIHCAVIGGMVETGMWEALSKRFEAETGIRVRLIAAGPKGVLDDVVRAGRADLVTMHASDTLVNFVADGLARDPQPWLRNDLIIVGPPEDPAGIRGLDNARLALKRIIDSHSPFVIHASIGSQEVLRNVLRGANLTLDPALTSYVPEESARQVLQIAAEKHAYTLVGRIPFKDGKMPNAGLVAMVEGDPLLRRPYLVAVINSAKVLGTNEAGARRLAAYLRDPATQKWVAEFGRGVIDDKPLFFPVEIR